MFHQSMTAESELNSFNVSLENYKIFNPLRKKIQQPFKTIQKFKPTKINFKF